jgi:predicted alpha-1,6-mannanase (GH76 family)
MPRGKGKTHIEIRVETRQLLREISDKLNKYYDEIIWEALELYRRAKGV